MNKLIVFIFLIGCSHSYQVKKPKFIRLSIYNYYIGCLDAKPVNPISRFECKRKAEIYLKQLEIDLK